MILDLPNLTRICGATPNPDNARAFLEGLNKFGAEYGLNQPHRLAQYVAQLAHESSSFRYDREIWGPTPAQRRYDTRTDLGNTPEADGDGFLFRGRGPIQITGRSNYRQFRDWARALDVTAPDFLADPEAVLTDPWEGLAPIWYWDTRDLNRYADQGNSEMITRRINGGLNGYQDRLRYFTRAGLVLLGYPPESVMAFQSDQGLVADGIAGPQTRAALHRALKALPVLGQTSSSPVIGWPLLVADFLKAIFGGAK